MSGFHQQLMQQELDGAKEAAASYEKQVKRLLAENATLRDGTGLAGELRTARDQLTAALDAKQKMAAELGERLRREAANAKALCGALRDAEGEIEAREAAAEARQIEKAAVAARRQHGVRLVTLGAALPSAHDTSALVHAFATWSSAACFAEVGSICADVRAKVAMLGDQTSALAAVADELILDESGGGLAARQLAVLHDNWRDVLTAELRAAEASAAQKEAQLGPLSRRLQRREDDLVLMIERFEKLQATRPRTSPPTSPHPPHSSPRLTPRPTPQAEHTELTERTATAAEGSSLHAVRLQADLDAVRATREEEATAVAEAQRERERLREVVGVREQQLALMVSRLERAQEELGRRGTHASAEVSTLQTTVARREAQLVALVKELYVLAAAEKTPGRIDHASRSRLFKQSADVYESLGAAAFGGDGDDGAPENESGQLPP